MRPGDLLFYPATPKSGIVSRIVGACQLLFGQGSGTVQYSHVAVVGLKDVQYEAWPPRARMKTINRAENFEVWRPSGASETQGAMASHWAMAHVGELYDAGRFFFGIFKTKNSNICSTFAARAWSDAGVDITKGAGRWVTPNDLIASGTLEKVS